MEWISVNDRLPKKGTVVLVSSEVGIEIAEYKYDNSFVIDGVYVQGATHWSLIPNIRPDKLKKIKFRILGDANAAPKILRVSDDFGSWELEDGKKYSLPIHIIHMIHGFSHQFTDHKESYRELTAAYKCIDIQDE